MVIVLWNIIQPFKVMSLQSAGGSWEVSQTQGEESLQRNPAGLWFHSLTKDQQATGQNRGRGRIMGGFPFLFYVRSQLPAVRMYSFGHMMLCQDDLQNPSSSTSCGGVQSMGTFTARRRAAELCSGLRSSWRQGLGGPRR